MICGSTADDLLGLSGDGLWLGDNGLGDDGLRYDRGRFRLCDLRGGRHLDLERRGPGVDRIWRRGRRGAEGGLGRGTVVDAASAVGAGDGWNSPCRWRRFGFSSTASSASVRIGATMPSTIAAPAKPRRRESAASPA